MDLEARVAVKTALSAHRITGTAPRGPLKRLHLRSGAPLGWGDDAEDILTPASLPLTTNLSVKHLRDGRVIEERDLGSGLTTVTWANQMIADAVNGSAMVPTLNRFKYMDTGLGSTAATDGDTHLQTPITSGPARVVSAIGNGQTATTANHLAILSYVAAIPYAGIPGGAYPYAITEWGLFDASSGGLMMDRQVFAVMSVYAVDSLLFTFSVGFPSNA